MFSFESPLGIKTLRKREYYLHAYLLGWNDGEHWGDTYLDANGVDKTFELHSWLRSNYPADLANGLMSDIKESLYDMKKYQNKGDNNE